MPNTEKKWTVMVYLAGDNNLDSCGVDDLGEMKKIGSTRDINIIAQFDREKCGVPTQRYYLRKGTRVEEDAVQSLGETNTGDPGSLIDFIRWGVTEYPAEHHMVVLWNHGAGWDDTDIFGRVTGKRVRPKPGSRLKHALFRTSVEKAAESSKRSEMEAKAILIDENAKDFLDNHETKKVLQAAKAILGRKLDIVGMDACLMSMAEVIYQMRDCVGYTVGSAETEPGEGWPYDSIVKELARDPDMRPDALSLLIVNKYMESYRQTDQAVTQSACDLDALAGFAAAFRTFAGALQAGLTDEATRDAIMLARGKVQKYAVKDNVDLIDLCTLLKSSRVPDNIKDASGNVIAAVEQAPRLVIGTGCCGSAMKNSRGLAIYFPTDDLSPLYKDLDFPMETGWNDFLATYTEVSRSR